MVSILGAEAAGRLIFPAGRKDLQDSGKVLLTEEVCRTKARAEAFLMDTIKRQHEGNHEDNGK
jgi:hypothetical protein